MPKIVDRWWWPFPLASGLGGSEAVVFGQKVFGRRHKSRVLKLAYRWLYAGDRAVWQVKYRLIRKHRYHLVDTGLPPGYRDEDERMLWACMAILGQYVGFYGGADKLEAFTQELAAEPVDWRRDMTKSQEANQDEAVAIWRWWKVERPANWKLHDEMVEEVFGGHELKFTPVGNGLSEMTSVPVDDRKRKWTPKQVWAMEEKLNKDDQDMLHRLIDIRRGLWT